jgi:hypothetical protein
MIEDMTVRNLSPPTQRSYVQAVAKFSRFFGRSAETLTLEEVRTFQVHIASKGVAWASLNRAVAALRFFYGVTLGMAEIPERIAYAGEPRRLPSTARAARSATDAVAQLLAILRTYWRWRVPSTGCFPQRDPPDLADDAARGLPVGAGGGRDRQEGTVLSSGTASQPICWRAASTSG